MPVKRAEWIAEMKFYGKEERMETTSLRLFFESCHPCSPFHFCGQKDCILCILNHLSISLLFLVHQKKKKNPPSSKIVLADFKQIHFLTNLS